MLQALLWDDEVREAQFPSLDEKVTITAKELEMSEALVKSFESDFSPERFTDDYQDQLRDLIEAKLAKGDTVDTAQTFGETAEGADDGGEVLDLMEALRRSVERNRAAAEPKKPAAKKAAPKKSASA